MSKKTFEQKVKFIELVEKQFGKTATISRKQVKDIVASNGLDVPNWLLNGKEFRAGRGMYSVPAMPEMPEPKVAKAPANKAKKVPATNTKKATPAKSTATVKKTGPFAAKTEKKAQETPVATVDQPTS